MSYLINLLEEQAESTVKGLTNDNYLLAKELLEKRYGDKQALTSAHMTKLLSLESVKFWRSEQTS